MRDHVDTLLARWHWWHSQANPKKRFVIYGTGRTGSTLLVSLLDSHPLVHCEGELLHDPKRLPKRHVTRQAVNSSKNVFGFKLLEYQLIGIQQLRRPRAFLEWLHGQGFRIVFLTRQNLLRHALSNINARLKNAWHRHDNTDVVGAQPIRIDAAQLLQQLQESRRRSETAASYVLHLPHLRLTYEDDLQDSSTHQRTVDTICDWLAIDRARVESEMLPFTPPNLRDFVVNLDEIVAKVGQSEYAPFLENTIL